MVGRLCYRSEDKINDESAEDFIKGVLRKGHWSVTEFAVFTIKVNTSKANMEKFLMLDHKYLIVDMLAEKGSLLITGTARALRETFKDEKKSENYVVDSLLYFLKPKYPIFFDEFTPKYPTYTTITNCELLNNTDIDTLTTTLFKRHKFVMCHYVVNRAVSHELVRHRPVSWMQESQRYCRYSENKFGNEVTFIKPLFFPDTDRADYKRWLDVMEKSERQYFHLLDTCSPQAARTVLPNSCKTELYQLCNLEQWEIFFGLRDAPGKAEPSMVEVAAPLHQQFKYTFTYVFGFPNVFGE